MSWMRVAVIAVLLAVLAAGAAALRSHLIGIGVQRGESSVQAKWDAQKKVAQQETLRLERERRADELIKFRNAERISDEQAQREAAREQRIAAGNAVADSLRSTIDRLNRRDLSTAGGDPQSVALAEEAATARQLFGSCTERYRGLAAVADGLRDQVSGLQDDAMFVCRAAPQTNKNGESP